MLIFPLSFEIITLQHLILSLPTLPPGCRTEFLCVLINCATPPQAAHHWKVRIPYFPSIFRNICISQIGRVALTVFWFSHLLFLPLFLSYFLISPFMSSGERVIWIYQEHLIFSKYTGQKCLDESTERYLKALKGGCGKPMYTEHACPSSPGFGGCQAKPGRKEKVAVGKEEAEKWHRGDCKRRVWGHQWGTWTFMTNSWVSVESHWVAVLVSFTAHLFSSYS